MVKVKTSHVVYGAFIAFILFTIIWYFIASTGPGKYDDLAKCLSDEGVKYYGAFWCSACAQQNQILGKSKEYVNYIECSTADRSGQTKVCQSANIESYPTWEFPDGSRHSGVMTPEQLSEKTGCPLSNGQ